MHRSVAYAVTVGTILLALPARAEEPVAAPPSAEASTDLAALPRATVIGEVGGGQARAAPDAAPTGFFYERVTGRFAASHRVELGATLRVYEDLAGAPAKGSSLYTSGDVVFHGALDATYELSEHWDVSAGVNGTVPSTRDVATTLQVGARQTAVDALVRTTTSSLGASAELGYDSADADRAHPVDVAIDGGLAATRFDTDQQVVQVRGNARTPSPEADALGQLRASATATLTLFEDTDVGASGAYFVYDTAHPANVGLFASTAGGVATSFGAGLPMMPPRWTLGPELGQRLGRLDLRAYYRYAELAEANAFGHTVGGRVQFTLDDFKVYVTTSYHTDVIASVPSDGWTAGAGVTLRY